MQYEDRITLSTPEGVDLDVSLAGIGSRFAAAALDALIQIVLIFAVGLVGGFISGVALSPTGASDAAEMIALAFWFIWLFLVLFGYDILFETLGRGRTIGKRALGIRVVRVAGGPVGFVTSAVRNLLRIVDFLPGFYAVGIVSILATERNQRLGDLAAGTLVVRDQRASGGARPPHEAPYPAYLHAPPPPAATAPLDPSLAAWDVSAITAEDLIAVRSFLERRHTIEPGARWTLAVEMSRRLQPKVTGAPAELHPEVFLEQVFSAKASRL